MCYVYNIHVKQSPFCLLLKAVQRAWRRPRPIQQAGVIPLNSYRTVVVLYGVMGVLLALLFTRLSPLVEAVDSDSPKTRSRLGFHRSRGVVLKLSTLFGLDAFAGGFVVQSLVAYWFHARFGVEPAALGGIFFGANILAGISALCKAVQ